MVVSHQGRLERHESGLVPNTASEKARPGAFRRFDVGSSPVHKLGHYGYWMPARYFEKTLAWYMETLNLKISDVVYNPKTGKDETCFSTH